MKKFIKIIWKIISWPPFGIIALIIGVLFIFLNEYYDKYFYDSFYIDFTDINGIVYSDNDCVAGIMDDSVYVVDGYNDSLLYSLNYKDFNMDDNNIILSGLAFDEDDNLYVSYLKTFDDSRCVQYEAIAKFDIYGDFVKDIVMYEYDINNTYANRLGNIYGLSTSDNKVKYLYVDSDLRVHWVQFDNQSLLGEDKILDTIPNKLIVTQASLYNSNSYAAIMSNGDIALISEDSYDILFSEDYDYFLNGDYTSYNPGAVICNNEKVYCRMHNDYYNLYEIKDNEAIIALDLCEYPYYLTFDEASGYTILTFKPSSESTAIIGISVNGEIFNDYNSDYYLCGIYLRSLSQSIIYILVVILKTLYPFILIYGIVFTFGNFVKWKFSILTKQLLSIIPIVGVSFFIIYIVFAIFIYNAVYSSAEDSMEVFGRICASKIDGDELKSASNYKEFVNSGKYYEYVDYLRDCVSDNRQDWSSIYSCMLRFVTTDENNYETSYGEIANSDGYFRPFISKYYSYDEINNLLDKDYGALFFETDANDGHIYYTCDISIFDSNDDLVGVFEVEKDMNQIDDEVLDLFLIVLIIMVVLLLILVVIISLISKFNVRKIKLASEAVTNIAKGEFDSRIKKTGKDELGMICKNVNEMAGQLDILFKEKDENEKFYYKFVPEQFKELLHKDKFTDLSLGDAESVDLTVLFCDIRSFSLNSEMMTAKENFEFINIIYGKAGPIIRKHNGFVDKYIGDAVMALFENADDAIACGKELYNEIVLNPETAKELNVSSINIGIGVHTGMARIGIVGEEERMSGTVISNTVNLSSRLESLTKQYNTAMIISKDTLDKMKDPDSLNLRYLGMIQVAGVNEVKALYEVLDCLDEERYVERFKTKSEFREAVRLYHLGELKKSVGMFKAIAKESNNDPCIEMYIKYIEEMIKEDNSDHNVFKFSRK